MKEIQILIKLQALKNFNDKLLLNKELSYYIEIYFSSNRVKSKIIKNYPHDNSDILLLNQTLCLKHYTGNRLEFWFRSETTDSVLGSFEIPLDQLTRNSEGFIDGINEFCLDGLAFATLEFGYQYIKNIIFIDELK